MDLEPRHLAIVQAILDGAAPVDCRATVFGSRASERARRGSDLDLLIDAGRRLTFSEETRLATAFEDSDLPFKVDIVDRHAVSDEFLRRIEPHLKPLARS